MTASSKFMGWERVCRPNCLLVTKISVFAEFLLVISIFCVLRLRSPQSDAFESGLAKEDTESRESANSYRVHPRRGRDHPTKEGFQTRDRLMSLTEGELE